MPWISVARKTLGSWRLRRDGRLHVTSTRPSKEKGRRLKEDSIVSVRVSEEVVSCKDRNRSLVVRETGICQSIGWGGL